jgi:hypothetical protein
MPLRQSPRRVLLRPRRRQPQSASHYRNAELTARRARASGNKSPLSARYGQNNPAIAIGRRNWTFAGSDEGGRRAAAIYSLIQSCKLNDVDPQAWLAFVLAKLPDHAAKKIDELLPWNWKAAQVAAQATLAAAAA